MEMLKSVHSCHSRIRLAMIQLHTKEPGDPSIHLVLQNAFSPKHPAPSRLHNLIRAHLTRLPFPGWGTECLQRAPRIQCKCHSQAAWEASPEHLSQVNSSAHCSVGDSWPPGREGLPRRPRWVSAQRRSRAHKDLLLGLGTPSSSSLLE